MRFLDVTARLARAAPLLAAVAALACDRAPRAPADTTRPDTAAPVRRPDLPANWSAELGPVFLVPAEGEGMAMLLYPSDPTTAAVTGQLQLLSPAGDSTTTQATLVAPDSGVCGEAPTLRLSTDLPHSWTAGLRTRRARVLAMDSIGAMTPADSARTVAELARLASALPGTEAKFVGLPFVVVDARQFDDADRQYLVAHLVRRLPQEATPLEERVFVVAERARTPANASFTTTHHLRSAGTEETADHYEALAVLRGDSSLYLLLARDRDARTSYELLERTRSRGWRVRWVRSLEC